MKVDEAQLKEIVDGDRWRVNNALDGSPGYTALPPKKIIENARAWVSKTT